MNKSLYPCPFCGKNPEIYQEQEECGLMGTDYTEWVIKCCVKMKHICKNIVINKWNKRRDIE